MPLTHVLTSLVLCLGISTGLGACQGTGQTNSATVPENVHLLFGQGGGFAGRWNGYTIEADGTVLQWSGMIQGDDATRVGALTPDQMADLWHRVEGVSFFAQERREVGNMTTFIEIRAEGREHRVSWITRVGELGPEAPPLERLYAYLRDIVQQASGKTSENH